MHSFRVERQRFEDEYDRRDLKSRAKEKSNVRLRRLTFVKSLVGHQEVAGVDLFELTRGEYLFFTVIQQVNLNYLMQYVDLSVIYGVIPTWMAYIAFHMGIGMPLYMLCTFMSSYTKRSFITFWDCIPIMQGFGFVLGTMRLLAECRNILASCLGVLMIYNLIFNRSAVLSRPCLGFNTTESCIMWGESYNVYCENKSTTVLVSTQYILRIKHMGFDRFEYKCCQFCFRVYGVIIGIWICIFLLSIFGIARLHKLLFRAQMSAVILVTLIALYAFIASSNYIKEPTLRIKESTEKFGFWVDTAMQSNMPGNIGIIFWMGTIKPKSMNSVTATLMFCPLKMFLCTAFMCFASTIIHGILQNYHFADSRCIVVSGLDVFLSFVPEIILHMRFGVVISCLWLAAITCLGISSTMFTTLAVVDSICERYASFNTRRIFVYMSICLFCLVLNAPLALNINFTVLHSWTSNGMVLLASITLLLINVTLMYLYSTSRIVDDYSFTFGTLPHEYWISVWKITPIICLYALIFVIYNMKNNTEERSTTFIAITYVISCVILLPIIIVALINICRELKNASLGTLLRPSGDFGPYNNTKRMARVYYFPQRDIRYRSTQLRCTHRCNANSILFSDEHIKQMKHLHNLVRQHKGELNPSFEDFMHAV